MITAVDTNVLIDVFLNDAKFGLASADALRQCIREGQIVVCDIVWAELAAVFKSTKAFEEVMDTLPLVYSPLAPAAATAAGATWRVYRKRGGTRKRVVADFVVAAHAQVQCDRLLTRDRGFYHEYFRKLRILDPTAR